MENLSMKNLFRVSCVMILALALMLVGCGESEADVGNPQHYSKDGVEFDYPGNWEVTDDAQNAEGRYLLIESPGDALMMIHIYSGSDALGIQAFASNFAKLAEENTPIGDVTASTFSNVTHSGGYEELTEQMSITVLGETVPLTRTYRRKAIGSNVCVLVGHVVDEDRSLVVGGFEQVFSSFKYNAP